MPTAAISSILTLWLSIVFTHVCAIVITKNGRTKTRRAHEKRFFFVKSAKLNKKHCTVQHTMKGNRQQQQWKKDDIDDNGNDTYDTFVDGVAA